MIALVIAFLLARAPVGLPLTDNIGSQYPAVFFHYGEHWEQFHANEHGAFYRSTSGRLARIYASPRKLEIITSTPYAP